MRKSSWKWVWVGFCCVCCLLFVFGFPGWNDDEDNVYLKLINKTTNCISNLDHRYKMAALWSAIKSYFIKPTTPIVTPQYGLPPPRVPHLKLDNDAVRNKRIVIIGDVHGCHDELKEMLELTGSHRDDAVVLLVGDLVNKGPMSKEVINLVRSMPNVHSVRGNHDENVLRELMYREKDENYELRDKYKWITELDESEREFLTQLPYTIAVPSKNIMIVHGGLVPEKPLLKQNAEDMTTIRNAFLDEHGWQGYSSMVVGVAWASVWPGPCHIYFGHDARRKLQRYEYATGLDTGCVYGGQLTAAVLDPYTPVEFVTVNSKKFDNDALR